MQIMHSRARAPSQVWLQNLSHSAMQSSNIWINDQGHLKSMLEDISSSLSRCSVGLLFPSSSMLGVVMRLTWADEMWVEVICVTSEKFKSQWVTHHLSLCQDDWPRSKWWLLHQPGWQSTAPQQTSVSEQETNLSWATENLGCLLC